MTPAALLTHYDSATLWPAPCGLDLPTAYARGLEVRALRVARGEQPCGYKIGFTNRSIWPRYQVFAPIWGTVYSSTLQLCEGEGDIALAGPPAACQPRIEPECVLSLRAAPPHRADGSLTLDDIFDCLDWVAPGFEIVHTHLPDWKFAAADTVADGGLHARLLVGQRVGARSLASSAEDLERLLAAAQVKLLNGDAVVDHGCGANVLDGPLHALLNFVQTLRACPGAPDVQPGDVITTGTWTDAWPVTTGQRWTAQFDAPLAPLSVRFV